MPQAPLMPKATAVWLIENTKLTFDQIAGFCQLHALEVQAIADGEVAHGMQGLSPVLSGHLDAEEIRRCEGDPAARLKMIKLDLPEPRKRSKGPKYTPVAKRQDKPDGIYWLVKNHPELLDAQVAKLLGTTKPTISAIRDRTHWNSVNIKPKHPVALGLCSQPDLEAAIAKAQRRIKNAEKRAAKAAKLAAPSASGAAGQESAPVAESDFAEPKTNDMAEAS